MTEHSFHGIYFPPRKGRKCNLCVRYVLLPMSRVAHYTQIAPKKVDVAGDIEYGAVWGLPRREHKFPDVLGQYFPAEQGVPLEHRLKVASFFQKEFSKLVNPNGRTFEMF